MREVRAALEAIVLLWPGVESRLLLGCPTYLVCEHPFALLVDGSLLLPGLPAEIIAQAPGANVQPMEKSGLPLAGWLRVLARKPEHVQEAIPLLRAAYETVKARSAPAP